MEVLKDWNQKFDTAAADAVDQVQQIELYCCLSIDQALSLTVNSSQFQP
jgi:hypothetical protein